MNERDYSGLSQEELWGESPARLREEQDHLYRMLHSARGRLCVAEVLCKDHWRVELGKALLIIDTVGSTLPQWSRFDQPEFPTGG